MIYYFMSSIYCNIQCAINDFASFLTLSRIGVSYINLPFLRSAISSRRFEKHSESVKSIPTLNALIT